MANMNLKLCSVFICFIAFAVVLAQEITVSTTVGVITGTTEAATFDGNTYNVKQFLGIPYAKPPVGELRFKKPEPLPRLQSPFRATKFGFICPQIILPGEPLVGVQDEDCLHLNIFIPTQAPDNSDGHAVMVWIHGGAFILGSSDEYDAKILAGFGNVIVVTINYRLGPLGFFSTMDSSCPGNFGLWDQKMALNWVRDNIAPFGGDINRITIFGESAGAISGIMQGMLPENNNLFKRIIASSGSPSVRSMNCSRNTLTGATYMAGKVGCASGDTSAMIECLRKVSWQDYMAAINALNQNSDSIEYLIFDPVVDGDFIKHEPRDIYEKSKTSTYDELGLLKSFDLLAGMNEHEGAYYIMYFVGDVDPDEFMPTREEMRKFLLPAAMNLVYNRTFSESIMRLVESEYSLVRSWRLPQYQTTVFKNIW
ncbi:putative inactive carboxylesterase 4 [Mercenaria mercenaria]|uniref:putative inactive carboxylesterase 4 n=1 Tax=Mercenaria mercenaria TaxID=6596 RepID=UPI00234F721D|nr:putative inactive carboxylesterase 4 [Mercenaria mercenaria]